MFGLLKNNLKGELPSNVNHGLVSRQLVIEFKEQWLNDIESTEIASANEIMMYLTNVMRGNEKDAFGLDPSLEERTKAAEKLMKAKGMFVQKVEVSNDVEDEKKKTITNIESLVKQMIPVNGDDISE